MEIRVLRYFLAIANEENMTAAAKLLNVTQPTLSKQIKDLEEELNTTLFIRESRKMLLTENGRKLRKRAEEILSLVDKAENELLETEELSGSLSIGGGETNAMHLIAKIIYNLYHRYPRIRYDFYSGNAQDVMERLDQGLLDFGVVVGDVDIKRYQSIRLPIKDRWGVLVSKDSPLANLPYIDKKQLLDIPLLCSKQALLENEFSSWLGVSSSKLNIIGTYNLIFNAAVMVEEGVGNALCIDKLMDSTSISNVRFIPLIPYQEASLFLIWKKSKFFSKEALSFIEELEFL